MDDAVWNVTVFTKNRERLLQGDVARPFFERVVAQAQQWRLLSAEHFTVDGTLIDGERRTNAPHASTTDPEARLARKSRGQEAQLAYPGPRADGESQRLGGRCW